MFRNNDKIYRYFCIWHLQYTYTGYIIFTFKYKSKNYYNKILSIYNVKSNFKAKFINNNYKTQS